MTAGFAVSEAYECNLLEENQQRLEVHDNAIELEVRPYQIITLRLIARA